MRIPEEILLALDQALVRCTNKRRETRRAFIRNYLTGAYTLAQLAEASKITKVTAARWRTVLRETMEENGQRPAHEPAAQLGRPRKGALLNDPAEEESVRSPDTSPEQRTKSRKPYLDNDTFRSYMDDLIVTAAEAEDPKAFQSIGRMKIDTTPGLKIPDTHININITFLGPQGLEALDGIVTDRVLRLAKMAHKLPPELKQALGTLTGSPPLELDPTKALLELPAMASSDPSLPEGAGRYAADTDVSDDDETW